MSLSPAGAYCLIQGYNRKEALVQGDENPCTRMSDWCFLLTLNRELCGGLAISRVFCPVTSHRMVPRPRKGRPVVATSLHGARLPPSCWQNGFSPVFERTSPHFFVLGYSLPRSVMKGFWVALFIAAQPVVNTSTTAAAKGTMNHHGIPPSLFIK